MLSHYEVLGVAPEASEGELRQQYQQRALQLHPDRPAGDHKLFTRLQEAWAVLADPHHRAEYDRQLRRDQLYQQYPVSEELFLEDLECSGGAYSHRCRCGGRCLLPMEAVRSTTDTELAVLCDNCSLAVMVLLPPQLTDFNITTRLSHPHPLDPNPISTTTSCPGSSNQLPSTTSPGEVISVDPALEPSQLPLSALGCGGLTKSDPGCSEGPLKVAQSKWPDQGRSSNDNSFSVSLGKSLNIETNEQALLSKPKTAQGGLVLPDRIGLLDCDPEETGSWSSNSSSSGASQAIPDQSTDAASHPLQKLIDDT